MIKEFEAYLRGVIEDIHKRHGQALWIHLNRGQHSELEGYPVNRVDSVPVFVSDDGLGEIREASIISDVEVTVLDYAGKGKDEVSWKKATPPTPQNERGVGWSNSSSHKHIGNSGRIIPLIFYGNFSGDSGMVVNLFPWSFGRVARANK